MTVRNYREILTQVGVLTSRPTAFLIVVFYAAAWALLDLATFDWHAIATLATWMMTLFIQRAEHRDTQAMHAKLDELLKAQPGARGDLYRLEREEPGEIEEERQASPASEGD